MVTPEIAAQLNQLLESERAGARGVIDMKAEAREGMEAVLDSVARDEARFCSMLRHHLSRLGYEPSGDTGAFYGKLAARPTLDAKLRLLDRGQSAVVRVLDELLPAIDDDALHRDLVEMREVHVRNIETCASYLVD
ncbi:MAG: DUF6306 domain-containing protein [Pseudomonadota bacterium]